MLKIIKTIKFLLCILNKIKKLHLYIKNDFYLKLINKNQTYIYLKCLIVTL